MLHVITFKRLHLDANGIHASRCSFQLCAQLHFALTALDVYTLSTEHMRRYTCSGSHTLSETRSTLCTLHWCGTCILQCQPSEGELDWIRH